MKLKRKNLQIAIDGPVASGKSIGAVELAKKLGILYVYSGAMYRAVAWLGIKNGLGLKNEAPIIKLLKKNKITLAKTQNKDRFCDVYINDKDITDELFSPEIHWGSSQVAVFPKVRKILVKMQQQIASNQPVVMEGRDITTVVLPNADLKIYMTADLNTRAKRRQKDLLKKGDKFTLKEVEEMIKKRDYNDSHRKASPLIKAKDAWIINTSKLSISQEVQMIIKKLKEMNLIG